MKLSRAAAGWLVGYLVCILLLGLGICYARSLVLANLASPEARGQWEKWQAETERQSKEQGPVSRKPVKSPEPPGLVLMRDHFAGVLVTGLLVGSFFFGFLILAIRGAVQSSHPADAKD